METRFQPGGTLRAGALYIERAADRDLLALLQGGELCYVLAPRQIGKSSLRARVQARLRAGGVRCATVDLSGLGKVPAGAGPDGEVQWYGGLLAEIAQELEVEAGAWDALGGNMAVHRFAAGLRRLVIERLDGPVVVFFDELDYLRGAGIDHEGFLAALRGLYNRRADEPALSRLTLCLLGVATPGELIEDPQRTPFNVGRAVALDDFTREEAEGLMGGLLETGGGVEGARGLLDAVYGWTEGHPYLMQRLCAELAAEGARSEPAGARVEALVARLFYGPQADTNLSYAENRFVHGPGVTLAQKVSLYRRLLLKEEVAADRQSRLHSELRLAGLIKDSRPGAGGGPLLQVRNRIIARLFDLEWVNQHSKNEHLASALVRWKDAGRVDDLLLRGVELEAALEATAGQEVEADLAEYLRASQEAEQRAAAEKQAQAERMALLEEEKREQVEARARLLRRGVVGLAVLLLGLVVAVGEMARQRAHAQREAVHAREAEARERQAREEAIEVADQILYYGGERLSDIPGTAAVRRELLSATHKLLDKLLAGGAGDDGMLGRRFASYFRRGELAYEQGKLDEAQKEYEAAYKIIISLAEKDPGESNNLSASLTRLGDVARDRGQLDAAQRYYERMLALSEKRAQAEPDSSQAQNNLSVSLTRLGDVAQARGQLDAAQRYYDRMLALDEKRAQAEPDSSQAQNNLSVSLERSALLARARDQLDRALPLFDRALQIDLKRAQISPTDAGAQKALIVDYLEIADLHLRRHAAQQARVQIEAAAAVLARIHAQKMLEGEADLKEREAWLNELRQQVAKLR